VAEPPQAKRGGRPPPIGWFGHPIIYLYIFLVFPSFFGFKKKKKKKVMGEFGNKKAKVVKLPQFESLGELSVTLETLKAKVKMGE
jgi:hypothetical protein